jgi:hypothetical protein
MRILNLLDNGPKFLFEMSEEFQESSDELIGKLALVEARSEVVYSIADPELPDDCRIYFLLGKRHDAERRLEGFKRLKKTEDRQAKLRNQWRPKSVAPPLPLRPRKKKHPSEEAGEVWENPINQSDWQPYSGECKCESEWLQGFIWGSGRKYTDSALRFSVSSRPYPIIERLKRTLEEEGFSAVEKTTDELGHNALIVDASHAMIRSWNLPPFSKRRLGDKVLEEFLLGVLDSRLRPHLYGLAFPGRSWLPDLSQVLRNHGYTVHTYDCVLTISKSQANQGILADFSRSFQAETDYYYRLTGTKEEDFLEEQVEHAFNKASAKLGEYTDPWPDDWFAGSLLSLVPTLEEEPARINLARVGTERMKGRLLEAFIARDMWFRLGDQEIVFRPSPSLSDWFKTNPHDSPTLSNGGIAGALAALSVEIKSDPPGILLFREDSLPAWLETAAKSVYFELTPCKGGLTALRNTVVLNPTLERILPLFREGPLPELIEALEGNPLYSVSLDYDRLTIIKSRYETLWGEHLFEYLHKLSWTFTSKQ